MRQRERGDLSGFTVITEEQWQEYRRLLRMRRELERICARSARTVGTASLRRLLGKAAPDGPTK